jgi:hypothetical protein
MLLSLDSDEIIQQGIEARSAPLGVPGADGDQFNLKGLQNPGTPGVAHRVPVQQTQQAEALETLQGEPGWHCAPRPTLIQQCVGP